MPTDTKEFSNHLKAFVAEALMIRAEHAYRGTRDNAKTLGVDLSADPDTQSFTILGQRYDNLLPGVGDRKANHAWRDAVVPGARRRHRGRGALKQSER
jgi:hypothetical protein